MVFIERHIFLLLALVACLASGLCFLFLENNAPGASDEQYVASVQERVKSETRQSTNELVAITDHIAAVPNYSFLALNQPTHYPYFIFRNKELLFWSNNRFIPDYKRIATVRYPKLVDFEQGRFIVSHVRTYRNRDTLDLFSLIMVYRHYSTTNAFLQSGYNPELFSLDPLAVNTTKGPAYQNIYDATPVFLFSVVPPRIDPFRNHSTPVNTVILATIGVLFLGLYVFRRLQWVSESRRYEVGFFWLAGYLLLLRCLMLYQDVPYLFIDNDLFSAKHYASSELAPSLGDLILNELAILLVVGYLVGILYRSRTYHWLINRPAWPLALLSAGLVFLSNLTFYFCISQLNSLYEESQYTLDLSLSLDFSGLRLASLFFFIVLSINYFLIQHILSSLFIRFNGRWPVGVAIFLVGTLITFSICSLLSLTKRPEPLYLLNSAYFLVAYLSRLPRYLYTFRYKTSLYFFIASFVCALTATVIVYRQHIQENVQAKQEMAKNLLAENDEYGELLLSKAQAAINEDPDIRRIFVSMADTSMLRRYLIQERVKNVYLDRYFDKYDTDVASFDANGNSLDVSDNAPPLSDYVQRFRQPQYRTRYNSLYFINEVDRQYIKEYVDFVDIRNPADSSVIGYIVLDLKLRKELPNSVYPELLVNDKLVQSPRMRLYSYAVYKPVPGSSSPRLAHNSGIYNYERKMSDVMLANPKLYDKELVFEDYRHLALRGNNGRTVVVSSPNYTVKNSFANFSFLYLILTLSVILVIGLYTLQYGFSRMRMSYSTRIQILLNIAFFTPLLLVVLIILGVISSNYVDNQEAGYVNNTKNIAANFQVYLDEHVRKNTRSKAALEQELEKIARESHLDINLFDKAGRLYTTTRKLMYESGHLAPYINTQAFMHIAENRENQLLVKESLGTKQFSTAYIGIKAFDGQLIGILSIPYFYARPELDRQLLEVISSALNVFSTLFLIFLVLSYFASTILTEPLRIITNEIRRTNLDHLDQPIDWQSEDEIGTLVNEYNRMLTKLEESKYSLAQSEKQSAWREMAKQVAHEIKNPLTPMKLTLQHLQRTLPSINTINNKAMNRTLDTLLDQIDNISDIATSFSDFANMPVPQNELVELTSVMHKAADLYADDKRVIIRRHIAEGPVWIMGDRQLLMRIMTNLIINGIQSVDPDKTPLIELRLSTNDDKAFIEVQDNGQGIPEGIRAKVFLPNFSTKQGGSGIGLALSKRGIEHAGGDIWFETVDGVGTSFFIAVPLTEPVHSQSAVS